MTTTLQNASLKTLVETLTGEQSRKLDMVVPTALLSSLGGEIGVAGAEPELSEEGVTSRDGWYLPTADADDSLGDRLDIPRGYLRRMRNTNIDLYDQNVNGWLRHPSYAETNLFMRTFRGGDGRGVLRAALSDVYRPIDHLDTLFTVLEAVRESGLRIQPGGCDLTDRRFYLRLDAPEVLVYSPQLLSGYRDPRTGQTGADNPAIQGGLLITNSETGYGSFQIAPVAKILVCSNGMTVTKDLFKRQHLGAKLEQGIIRWSDQTNDAALALIKNQARDAIRTFLDVDYMQRKVNELERAAGVEVREPEKVIKTVTTKLRYSEAQRESIMNYFIKGADPTTFGVVQAITAHAQDESPDVRYAMENDAFEAFELALAAAR